MGYRKRAGAVLIGQRFGRLVVLALDTQNPNKHEKRWICKCDCGSEKTVTTGHLTTGTVKSCGCLRKEQAIERFRKTAKDKTRHGEAGSALYGVWHSIIQRCENPNSQVYKWYGGKGVKICDEWHDYAIFSEWAKANGYIEKVGVPHKEKLSIDRIDSGGDYCPENCRWITVHENTKRASETRWGQVKSAAGSARAKSIV